MASETGNEAPFMDEVPPDTGETKKRRIPPRGKRWGSAVFGIVVFVVFACAAGIPSWFAFGWPAFIVAAVVGLVAISTVHFAYEWERIVVLRFGTFSRIVEPGLYFTIPVIEQVALHVDQRINVTPFLNERALTSDLAPVDVDAVVFWMVWDAKAAYTQVVDYPNAVSWSAQTALRDAIGQINLTDVPIKRLQIDHEVQERLEDKVSEWGISIISVEIRDIVLPDDLQNAMSRAAQAERERDARIILAEAEKESSHMFVEAAESYRDCEIALQLRMANLLYEGVKEHGGMVIVPSSFTDSIDSIEKIAKALK